MTSRVDAALEQVAKWGQALSALEPVGCGAFPELRKHLQGRHAGALRELEAALEAEESEQPTEQRP